MNSSSRSKIEISNEIKTFVCDTKVKYFCMNVENGNRVVGFFFRSKKSYICEFTFKFSSLTNFSNRNVETNILFMIAKTKLFRSNKIMFKGNI